MKKCLLLGCLLYSVSGFSQSYMILNNGVTLTTDKAAFVYDFSHFILPYKVTLTGEQFLAEEGKLITIDEKGFLYRKDEKAPSKVKGKGANYIIAENGTIYTFDQQGFFYKYDKDSALKKAEKFGGTFFTVKSDAKKKITDLYTLNSKGNYFKIMIDGLNPEDISVLGGRYFQTSSGMIYTVTKEGFVYSKPDMKVGALKKIGGNYFIDSNDILYTITEDGFLLLPTLPKNLNVSNVTKLGSNYFLNQDGNLFGVDQAGNVVEREVKDHQLKEIRVLSI